MTKQRQELFESAYRHTISEFGLENVKLSLGEELSTLQRAHDAIHEFMLLAALLAPSSTGKEPDWDWHSRSAFLIYHWEVFHHAHRSLCEALCAYYNPAFVLLRVAFELLIKGAFWDCLSHREFRENSPILDKCGGEVKKWLKMIFEEAPGIEKGLEKTSASIYDKISPRMEDRKFRPSVRTMVRQLDDWDMFIPIPDAEARVYEEIYSRLSGDVHVAPDRIDIGRRLIAETPDIFEQEVLPEALREYVTSLHAVMDLAVVVELNVMGNLVNYYEEARANLKGRFEILERLGLQYSLKRAKQFLGLPA